MLHEIRCQLPCLNVRQLGRVQERIRDFIKMGVIVSFRV